ncbi:MAG: conjugal transfer protein TraR [Deltaproteobacteria bacterium]|nr:conjugal transfer protein TraR [Deltaproteobacteria bacterium]
MSLTESSTANVSPHNELEARLREHRAEWEQRLERIQRDRRRERGPLDPDFEEQATQRENDETLDALDARGRQELSAIAAALDRISAGTYGQCARCEEPIPPQRLRAQPAAIHCLACANVGQTEGRTST